MTYEFASWTSPLVAPGFGLTEAVASWNATTPGKSWVELRVRGTQRGHDDEGLRVLGRGAAQDPATVAASTARRSTGRATPWQPSSPRDSPTRSGYTLTDWQLEVRLLRPVGSAAVPTVDFVGAMASALPDAKKVPWPALLVRDGASSWPCRPTTGGPHWPLPAAGQRGEAWCSPTSTAMVVGFWGAGPTAHETRSTRPSTPRWIYRAQRLRLPTHGAGNWPFNTACYVPPREATCGGSRPACAASPRRSKFIAAGIPLVVSVSFKKRELTGAGQAPIGHLMVIRGFTAAGDVIANDPASPPHRHNTRVRVIYDREEFENVWVRTAGGIVYVIAPAGHARPHLPPRPTGRRRPGGVASSPRVRRLGQRRVDDGCPRLRV